MQQAPAHGVYGPPPSPQHSADLPLSGLLARAVQQRTRNSDGAACCAACASHEPGEPCESAGQAPLKRAPLTTLQRTKDEGYLDSIWETLKGAASKIDVALDRLKYGPCDEPAPKPDQFAWYDDKGLESLRHRKNSLLSRTKTPRGGGPATLKLFKQALHAWGCETLGLDLLPQAGASGPFGPETAAAVQQFQLSSGLQTDGVVGAHTIGALDSYVGGLDPDRPPTPTDVGGDESQGASSWSTADGRGAIYFATKDASLSKGDRLVLTRIANAARYVKEISFELSGFADKREHGKSNQWLSGDRAAAVRDFLAEEMEKRNVPCDIQARAMGEIERPQDGETDEALKPFRRVDVVVSNVVYPEKPKCGGDLLCIEVTPQAKRPSCLAHPAREWQAALENPQVVGAAIVWTSAQVIIRMKHPNPDGIRWQYTYVYSGWGAGGDVEIGGKAGGKLGKKLGGKAGKKRGKKIGEGIDKAKDAADWVPVESPVDVEAGPLGRKWFDFTTSKEVKITDFKGPARHFGASSAAGPSAGHDTIRVNGLKRVGANEVELTWWPVGIGIGIQASWDITGELRHFSGCRPAPADES